MTTTQPTFEDFLAWLANSRGRGQVHFDEKAQCWQVLGHPETSAVLSDPAVFSSDLTAQQPEQDVWVPRTAPRPLISAFANGDLAFRSNGPHSMITRCGPPPRLPDARPGAPLAGAARPIRREQGHRDPGAPSRGRRAALTPLTPAS